jgi:hypothetical protein
VYLWKNVLQWIFITKGFGVIFVVLEWTTILSLVKNDSNPDPAIAISEENMQLCREGRKERKKLNSALFAPFASFAARKSGVS